MDIKLNIIIRVIIIFIFIGVLTSITTEKCSAEEQQAEISFLGEPTYILENKIIKNNQVIGRIYTIDVTLYNAGNLRSEQIKVNITDEEGFSLVKYTYINPGETKIISFNWSTILDRDQEIHANYFPSDLDTVWTRYNSGSKTFMIKINDKDGVSATNTPGFELTLIISSIIFYGYLRRRK